MPSANRIPFACAVDVDARGDDVADAHRRKDVLGHGRATRLEDGAVLGTVRRAVHRAGPTEEGVVEREHVVALGLGPPRVDQLLQALRLLGREVARLGEVVGEVEEQPVVLVELAAAHDVVPLDCELPADVVGRRLPAVVVDRAAPEHLEVLGRAGAGADASANVASNDFPSIGCWSTPSTVGAGSMPAASRIVGMRSTA